jgi:hypothetical protein
MRCLIGSSMSALDQRQPVLSARSEVNVRVFHLVQVSIHHKPDQNRYTIGTMLKLSLE